MSSRDKNPQVYVRGFSRRTGREELKDAFKKYGKIRDINVKNGYAFIVSPFPPPTDCAGIRRLSRRRLSHRQNEWPQGGRHPSGRGGRRQGQKEGLAPGPPAWGQVP